MNRRALLGRGLIGASALSLSACKILDGANTRDTALRNTLEAVGKLSYRAQRLIGGGHTLAPEFTQADIRQGQRPMVPPTPTAPIMWLWPALVLPITA